MITREEVVTLLDALSKADPEAAHVYADNLLCAFLFSEGCADVAEAFESACARVGFRYA